MSDFKLRESDRKFSFRMSGDKVCAHFGDNLAFPISADEVPVILKELADINWILQRVGSK